VRVSVVLCAWGDTSAPRWAAHRVTRTWGRVAVRRPRNPQILEGVSPLPPSVGPRILIDGSTCGLIRIPAGVPRWRSADLCLRLPLGAARRLRPATWSVPDFCAVDESSGFYLAPDLAVEPLASAFRCSPALRAYDRCFMPAGRGLHCPRPPPPCSGEIWCCW